MVRETLITKPDIGIHKAFFPVIRLRQGLTGHILDASARILFFVEKILEKHNGVRFYDFDFSAFVFLDTLMAEEEQQEQAKKQAEEVRQAISVWNVFEQHMHLSVWNSIDQSYQRVMTLLNRYGSFYPQFFAGDVQGRNRTYVRSQYNAVPYVASRTFHNVVQHLHFGNRIEPASERIKRDFERQMFFFNWIQDEYRKMSVDMPQIQSVRQDTQYLLEPESQYRPPMQYPSVLPYSVVLSELYTVEQQLVELKNYVEAAVERGLNPEWQEQLSVIGQRLLNMTAVLSDIIHEKQTLHTVLQQLDTEFEQQDSAIIRDRWKSFMENVYGETTQIDQLVSLQQYMETISRKPCLLITNEDIHNVAKVEDSILRLENNLVHKAGTYNDITPIIRTMQEYRFESREEEKAFFIDSIKKYSTAVRQKQKVEKLSGKFTEEIVKNLTKYVDLETLVSVVQQYSTQEWQEFRENIQEQRNRQVSVLVNRLTENQAEVSDRNQSEVAVYESVSRMVLREEMADGGVWTLGAESGRRPDTGQEIMQFAPSVKQSKEKLKQQELKLERLNITLRENKHQVDELTKEQLKLKQIIQEQSTVIEQIGSGEAMERMLMNRLRNDMRIERMRRGIR